MSIIGHAAWERTQLISCVQHTQWGFGRDGQGLVIKGSYQPMPAVDGVLVSF